MRWTDGQTDGQDQYSSLLGSLHNNQDNVYDAIITPL